MPNPTIETAVWEAVSDRWGTIPLAFPISDGVSFSPPADASPYLRVSFIPNRNVRRALNGADAHIRLSLLQIDVFSKRDEKPAVGIEFAGIVAEHFPADLKMRKHGVTVRVMKAPDVRQSIPDGAYIMTPVVIQLETLA